MPSLKFFLFLDFLRDILILIQVLLIFYLILKRFSKDPKSGLFLLFQFFFLSLSIFLIVNYLKTNYPYLRPISYYFEERQQFDSFPSSHSAFSFAYSFFLLPINFNFFIFSFFISIFIAILSVLSLAHWPMDVFFGFFIAFFITLIIKEISYSFHRFYFHNRKEKTQKVS